MFGITRLLVSSSTRPRINNTLKVKTKLITGPYIFLLLWTRFGRYLPIFKTWCRNKKESPSWVDKRHVLKLMEKYICRGVKRARTLRFLLNIQCLTVHSHLNIERWAAILRTVVAMFKLKISGLSRPSFMAQSQNFVCKMPWEGTIDDAKCIGRLYISDVGLLLYLRLYPWLHPWLYEFMAVTIDHRPWLYQWLYLWLYL